MDELLTQLMTDLIAALTGAEETDSVPSLMDELDSAAFINQDYMP